MWNSVIIVIDSPAYFQNSIVTVPPRYDTITSSIDYNAGDTDHLNSSNEEIEQTNTDKKM